MPKQSVISIRETQLSKKVNITSDSKPEIYQNIREKWQSLVDTAARIVDVPAGLIMQLNSDTIQVFLSSNTEGNPYEKGEEAELIYGLYCETVIGTQEKLLLPDARKSKVWKHNNPDVDLNMVAYLGFPINWPDGEVFGTVCLLDNKENYFTTDFESLLKQLKYHIEDDLKLLLVNQELEAKNKQLEQLNKTKSRFLSLISHDIRGNIAAINSFLQLISAEFDEFNTTELKNSLLSLSQVSAVSYQAFENLLRWSKNDLVALKPEITAVDLGQLINEIIPFFEHIIGLKAIQLKKYFSPPEVIVNTDKNMLGVIVRNIISNAVKYNKRGGKVIIRVEKTDDKHFISIEDTGIGMTDEVKNKLFSYNESGSNIVNEESAGIGLLLTKEFIDKLGMEILVESEPEKGTIFRLTL